MSRGALLGSGLSSLRLSLPCKHWARVLPKHLQRAPSSITRGRVQPTRNAATFTSPQQAQQISVLQTLVDKQSAAYQENDSATKELLHKFEELHTEAARGGSDKARQKHVSAGKMLVRE